MTIRKLVPLFLSVALGTMIGCRPGVAEAALPVRSDDYQQEPIIYLIEKIEVG